MSKHLQLIIVSLALLLIYHQWFLTTAPNLAPDLGYAFRPFIWAFPFPWLWANSQIGDGMGSYVANTIWNYPTQTFYQLLLILNIPFWFQMKYLALLPALLVASWGLYKLSKIYKFNSWVTSFFYLTNTYFLVVTDGGQLNLSLAYSLLPLTWWLFLNTLAKDWLEKLKFGLLLWLMGSFDLRVVFIFAMIAGLYLVSELFTNRKDFDKSWQIFRQLFSTAVMAGLVMLTLNLYWLLPGFLAKPVRLPDGFTAISQVSTFSFSKSIHSLYLQQPHWYLNAFGKVAQPQWYFGLLPLLAFLPLVFFRKNKSIVFLAAIGLLGVFLAKGSQPPFGLIYQWLFQYLPGFQMFRDPSKFYILIAFSYSILIGTTANFISTKWRSALGPIIMMIFLLLLAWPTYGSVMSGTFAPPLYQSEYVQLNQQLANQANYFRTFWIPLRAPLGYSTSQHPSTEATSFVAKRPFATQIKGDYELFNFLRSPGTPQLLDIAAIKYIFYPYPDERKESLSSDDRGYYNWFNRWLKEQTWLKDISPTDQIAVFENQDPVDHFFTLNNLAWVSGPDDTYSYLAEKSDISLQDLGLIHLNEDTNLIQRLPEFPGVTNQLVLNKNRELDLAFNLVDRQNFYPLHQQIQPLGDDPSGWWSRGSGDFLFIKGFLLEHFNIDNHDFDLNQGYAISEGSHLLKTQLNKSGQLYSRVLESSSGGSLAFKTNGLTKVIDTKDENNTFHWVKIGSYDQQKDLTIESRGGINIINSLAILDDLAEKQLIQKSKDLTHLYQPISIEKLSVVSTGSKKVNYTFINPTKYKVQITEAPTILAFSESFDGLWQLKKEGQVVSSSLPLYSLINGFYVAEAGDYTVEFAPQRWAYIGFYIGVFCLLVSLGIIGYSTLKKRSKNGS